MPNKHAINSAHPRGTMNSADTKGLTADPAPTEIVVNASFSFPQKNKSAPSADFNDLSQPTVVSTPVPTGPERSEPVQKATSLSTPLTQADRDANLFEVALPSGNFFYPPGARIYSGLVRGKQQAKFSRASQHNSLQLTVEAVNSCLSGEFNAMDLTVPDFFYLLYWLRLHSYTKSQFSHVSVCTNPEHLARVAKQEIPPDTLKTVSIINNTMLEETLFDPACLEDLDLSCIKGAGIELRPALVKDTVELTETYDSNSPDDADAIFLVDNYAAYIASVNGNSQMTLKERVAFVENLDPDVLSQIRSFAVAVTSYGVKELIRVRCKECGAEHVAELAVSAHNFF